MEEAQEVKNTFSLPDKKVTVRLVDRPRGAINDKSHVLYNLAPGATIEFCPRNKKGEKAVKCPLTSEEIKFFENKELSGMAFSPGELSPYADDSTNFWRSRRAKIKLGDTALSLDLKDPSDYLKYKILLSNDDTIAPSLDKEHSKLSYIFVMESDEEQQKKVVNKGDKLKRAWKLASKMEDNKEGMIDFLSVVGKRPSANSKAAFLIAEIDKFIENDINEFLDILEDDKYEAKVMLTKALQVKAVTKDGHRYFLADGTPLCNRGEVNNLSSALAFLTDDNNQDIVMTLEAKILK